MAVCNCCNVWYQESVESVAYGREDQATQTDDEDIYDPYPEPDDSPFKVRAVRPTNFNCKKIWI